MVTASAPHNAFPVSEPSASFVQRGISILTLLSLFIVVCTPVVYVGGRAYHDGWYERLHLNPGLFPADTQAILTDEFIGWTGAVSRLMKALLTLIRFASTPCPRNKTYPLRVGRPIDTVLNSARHPNRRASHGN